MKALLTRILCFPFLTFFLLAASSFTSAQDSESITSMISPTATSPLPTSTSVIPANTPTVTPTPNPVPPPTYAYPNNFPLKSYEFSRTSIFTLQEKTGSDGETPDGDCLSYDTLTKTCLDPSNRGAAASNGPLKVLTLGGVYLGLNMFMDEKWATIVAAGVGVLLFATPGQSASVERELSDESTQDKEPNINNDLSAIDWTNKNPLEITKRAVADNTVGARNVTFHNHPCITGNAFCPQQVFRLERIYPAWGDYGVLTTYNNGLDTNTPECLTKEADNSLTLKACAYQEDAQGNRTIWRRQLWKFRIYGNIEGALPVEGEDPITINRMSNFTDPENECISGVDGSSCRKYYVGFVYEENGCTIYPDGRPGICSTKKRSLDDTPDSNTPIIRDKQTGGITAY